MSSATLPRDAFVRTAHAFAHRVTFPPRWKRSLDLSVVLLALLMTIPVMLVVALLVRATSRGPVLYRQRRIGHAGQWFTILKFRTMVDGADQKIEALLFDDEQRAHIERHGKFKRDPRVTPIGRLLRVLSLDELPQLWNVVRGDMSLVGPRPRWDEDELDHYGDDVSMYLSVLPGLTGPWQVGGRNLLSDPERVDLDLAYARSHDLGTDVRYLLKTIPVLLWPFRRGAF